MKDQVNELTSVPISPFSFLHFPSPDAMGFSISSQMDKISAVVHKCTSAQVQDKPAAHLHSPALLH